MDNLPPELLHQILLHVPKSSLPECRLICRSFSTIAFPILFSFVPKWLNFEMSHRAIIALAHDACNRPAVMWSPWATGPDGPVDQVWIEIVWKLLMKGDPPGLATTAATAVEELGGTEEVEDSQETALADSSNSQALEKAGQLEKVWLTSANFAQLSGREEMTENRLRTGQNRYLLHRAYASKVGGVF